MIYTLTFNPSLDYIVRTDVFTIGQINRTTYEQILPGGKGINVSIVLRNLGIESTALGFVAGFTGKEIEERLRRQGISTNFIHLAEGLSRINVKMKAQEETEINGQGPRITEYALEQLYAQLDNLTAGDLLVISGSIPNSLPDNIYEQIMARLHDRDIHIVVDATKDLLKNVLRYHPFLIKPNNHELGELFGVTLTTRASVIPYAKRLQALGAQHVLVSMAGEGAVLVTKDGEVFTSPAPKGEVINSVGAGDSMVAGFLTGYSKNGSCAEAFRYGVAAGSASAFSASLATQEEVETLLSTLL